MTTLSVSLSDELADFIRSKVASGSYASTNDVVVDALRLLQQQDHSADLQVLRQAWQDGLASGDFQSLDLETVKQEGRRRLATRG